MPGRGKGRITKKASGSQVGSARRIGGGVALLKFDGALGGLGPVEVADLLQGNGGGGEEEDEAQAVGEVGVAAEVEARVVAGGGRRGADEAEGLEAEAVEEAFQDKLPGLVHGGVDDVRGKGGGVPGELDTDVAAG
jgi:hypothetical protein